MTAVQGAPAPAVLYGSFPEKTVPGGVEMFRAHSTKRDAWWFDDGPLGRFTLARPRGTCCTASRVETAVREKVRDEVSTLGYVSRAFAESFQVSAVSAPRAYRCAAVSSSRAERFSVVRALVTTDDYVLTQSWAAVFASTGFEGISYGSAYTTGRPSAFALFGDAGAAGPGFTARRHLSGVDACTAAGMTVVGPPRLGALTVI